MPSIEPKPAIAVKRRASPSRQNLPGGQIGSPKKAPPNPSYTVRVICCVIFIFLTELCLAHYIYRLINSEMRSDYVKKDDFRLYLMREIHSESGRDEISRLIREISTSSEFPQRNSNATSNSGVSYNNNNNSGSNRRKKRSSSSGSGLNNYNSLSSTSPARGDEPHVEFFNPELRGTLEAQDELSRQHNGGKGSAPGGDSWIWLTSNSRIPEKVLEGYCKKVNQFCPPGRPGPVGPPGNPGFKGERGDKGFPGIPGQMGHRGLPGLPGVKGAKGDQGRNGLDGRDGIPGEPGLDGLPGRNGHDGLPGIDGLPGFPGKDGRNGTDGRPGLPGPQGPQGPQGPRGIAGPRGRPGRPGNHGIPGIPGISTYKIKGGNGSADLLIPPSIAGAQSGPMGPISVAEGSNVRLHCSATGVPTPHVTWQRLSNKPINRGAWEDIAVSGHTLNITKVNREHMGIYLCIADNGIPPQANQTFNLEVEFPPLVRITNQMVGVVNGTTAVLECETEAFPEPVRYWERSDGRLLENGEKYRIYNGPMEDEYKGKMQLNITRVGPADFSYLYYCVSKNAHQSTRGEFTLYELDPRKPSQIFDTSGKVTVYGAQPPDKVSLEDLCGPPVLCPECHPAEKETKCDPISGGVSLIDLVSRWDVRPFGDGRYTGYPNRSMDCVLYAVGKPVYHRSSNYTYGCWMRDAHALTDKDGEKFWVTNEDEPTHLYQFDNKTVYRDDFPSRTHDLPIPFQGNTHIFYHGSFFYNAKNSNMIVRYSPSTNNTASYSLPFVYKENMTKLYVTRHNYMDFNVDDNGVWVIFPVPDSGNLAVMKFDPVLMKPQHIWNITVNHHKVGEMFIVCGVLYAVDSVQDKNTKIRFALDLYKSVLLDVELTFSNPFKRTTMLGYNHKNKELYSWDKGNQLTYPVRYHEIGYNYSSKEEKNDFDDGHLAESQIGTGYEIN